MMMMMMMTAEIQRLRKEMESASERSERQQESLQQKLATADKDYKAALQQAKHAHDEDVARLTEIQASRNHELDFGQFFETEPTIFAPNQTQVMNPIQPIDSTR